ncbi:hypothetical protein BX070DRAFT_254569 [Coemansia spiralis]|nr:hypothetical protein BX070DRAFT_254569 [Coemansia spiralis]
MPGEMAIPLAPGQAPSPPLRRKPPGAQPIKKFSTYAILNGGACNMDDKPAKLVSVHPGSYYVGFDIPKTCAENELYKALDSLDMPLSVHLDKKTNPPRWLPSEPRRIIPCEADMTILSLSKVNTVDVAAATRSIADALQGYGTIRDILFQGGKRVFSQTVMVLFKRNSGVTLPSHILIEGRHIHLAGRHVEPSCTYCKKEGHFIGKCPRLARLKKRATTVEAKSGPAKKPNQSTSEASASTSAPRANSTRAPVSISAKGKQSQAQITSDLETPPAKPLKRARRTATVSIADLVYTDRATPLLPTKPHPEEAKAAAGKCAEADADASDVGAGRFDVPSRQVNVPAFDQNVAWQGDSAVAFEKDHDGLGEDSFPALEKNVPSSPVALQSIRDASGGCGDVYRVDLR